MAGRCRAAAGLGASRWAWSRDAVPPLAGLPGRRWALARQPLR
ncbi:hypothetical protein [Saccharothrix carnea]|nr:hypothetical protein [Saccharothrix carnea]